MDAGSSSRPVRRRAHVCRVCDSAFTCKAELLEHEQEVHTASSVSTPSSKRRSVTAHSGGTSSVGVSPIMLHTPAKKASVPVNVTPMAANLLVDHEEVYESRRMTDSPDIAVQKTVINLATSMQQKFVSSGGGSSNAVRQISFSSGGGSPNAVRQISFSTGSGGGSSNAVRQISFSTGSGGGTSNAVRQISSILAENRQASSRPVARSHDQAGDQNADVGRIGVVAGTNVVSQSTDSPSHQLSQAKVTATQNRGPSTVAASSTSASAAEVNKSPKGEVIKALGLKRKGGMKDVTVASTDEPGVEEDDTKPPVSETMTDICGSTVDSRDVARYEVLGTINAEPRVNVSGSDVGDRIGRNAGMQSVLLPNLTKEEATDCVAGLHQGDSYAASVNNDELQLLAAVSSTRSRDIVTQPDKPSPVPTPQEPEPQQMTDVVMSDLTDIVEQEVVLETTACDSEPRRQTKKRTSAPKSPVCLVKLPMTPREFTSTDGAKKRMVAITVARTPRMVSVLLRNQGNAGPEEPKEQQETAAEANVEQPSDEKKEDDTNTNVETSTETVDETVSAESIAAEAAAAARAIEFRTVPPRLLKNEADNEIAKPKMDVCLYCEQEFLSDELAEHIALDHVCDQCGRKFRQPANLRKHVKINHENVKPHRCPVCNKAFPYASYLAEHMPVHDVSGEERRFACEHCNKSFMRASGLRKHTKEEHLVGPKPFVCPHCDRRYAYRCALEGHMRRHSALRPFSCQTCGAGFKHISNLQKHVKTQHPEPCNICGDTTATCEHTLATRSAQKTRHRCARCGRKFESAAALQVHERVHTGEKPEVCDTCGRAFQHRSNLQKHMMKHAGRRPHACTECPRAFYARHSLLAHMRRHTGESPYHCETCGKRFCTKNSLQVHMNLHNDVRPFACDTCGRQFAQLGNLQKHMSVHTGERPHQCPECSRCFSDVSAMRRHCAAIHDRDARYRCETCGKRFLHLSSARSHRMQHEGVKPHSCSVCGKMFTHRSGWLRHCRVHQHADPDGVVRAVVGDDSKEVVLKPGEYIVYLTE